MPDFGGRGEKGKKHSKKKNIDQAFLPGWPD